MRQFPFRTQTSVPENARSARWLCACGPGAAVLPYVGGEPYIPGEVSAQIDSERTRQAQTKDLESLAAAARAHGVTAQTHLHRGDPVSSLVDLAEELGATLVEMATHGRTGITRFPLGSVADRVLRGGVAPVLLLRSFPPFPHRQDLSRVLVPLDGSVVAEAPLFTIVPTLAGPAFRTITLLRVVDPHDGEIDRRLAENTATAPSVCCSYQQKPCRTHCRGFPA